MTAATCADRSWRPVSMERRAASGPSFISYCSDDERGRLVPAPSFLNAHFDVVLSDGIKQIVHEIK